MQYSKFYPRQATRCDRLSRFVLLSIITSSRGLHTAKGSNCSLLILIINRCDVELFGIDGVLKSSGLPSGYCHPFSKVSILFRRQSLCQVPYVDCPCCVPDTYAKGGDIDCDFQYSASPFSVPLNSTPPAVTEPPPTLLPTEASTPTTGSSSGDSDRGKHDSPHPGAYAGWHASTHDTSGGCVLSACIFV